MGVDLGDLLDRKRIEIKDLRKMGGCRCFQYPLPVPEHNQAEGRHSAHGQPGQDNIPSIIYRTTNLLEAGIKVAFVFDGEPPTFKADTLEQRSEVGIRHQPPGRRAQAEGREGFKYAQAASRINSEILEDGKRLILAIGLPVFMLSEGEAQAAYMAGRGDVDHVASQDYDTFYSALPRW